MKIADLVRAGSAALLALLLLAGVVAATRVDAIRMGGAMQVKSRQAADLIADILPPPEYVIESYLEATLLLQQPQRIGEARTRLRKLHDDYDTRHLYWKESDLDPALKQGVTVATHDPAAGFWQEIEDRFLPAMARGDRAAAAQSYAALSQRYAEHRAQVDKLVADATAYQAGVERDAGSLLTTTIVILGVLALILLGLIGACAVVLLRKVVRPLVEVSDVTARLARGETAIVPHRNRTDELGAIALAVEQFRVAAVERAAADARIAAEQQAVTATLSDSLAALSDGNLTAEIHADFPPAYAALKANFNAALASLRTLIGTVTASAASIRAGSGEIAQASETLARRTEANAASLEETSAAVAQMDGRLKATAAAAHQTVARADGAISVVSGGRAITDEAVEAMTRVSDSAKGIDSVIEGLDKIAFQTRVLAMNAAVEAGRAGEAGRGFAVVADLVSALAMRAEEEAGRARDQLTATQNEVVAAVEMVQKVDTALAEIAGSVGEVHALLGQIAADNQTQSAAVTQISAAIGTMDQSTQQNAAMVEETSAAARNLSTEVTLLADQAGKFVVDAHPGPSRTAAPTRANPARAYTSPVRALPMPSPAGAPGAAPDEWASF
ncbi:methyl-accepting chemotaxis protein [Sphingomonas psychrotolerans]|uniref:Methyl-accepting chemotaxis protein n=1 Tax=Sphingomonas psychrotolerans TaxID=1327635 RepID=A0ABU3N4K3_9SPHN|nr:methyl-accepting chemotaxis protein [Sphingomonas psychrotolerans]MDT8759463.1 methyl-accepting chemotaxis protein [Sphingomonas psychrotolerans]